MNLCIDIFCVYSKH